MRERARDKGRLEDIVAYSNNVSLLVEGYSLEALVADKRTYYSVMKNVEIVGEAAYMLTLEFKESHPKTPWNVIIKMRHVLVHGYYSIQMPIVWDIVKNDFPQLRPEIVQYIEEEEAKR